MDERVSDFDDIFIIFMNMQMSLARVEALNNTRKHFGEVLFMYFLTQLGLDFFMTKYVVVLLIMDMVSAKSDVSSPKEKSMFLETLRNKNCWGKKQRDPLFT